MSQIVWMFSLLPDSIFVMLTYAIFAAGLMLYIASKLVQWIPIMMQYRIPAVHWRLFLWLARQRREMVG